LNEISITKDYIYLIQNGELIVLDKDLTQKKSIKIKNSQLFNDLCIDIDKNIVKMYKKSRLYYSYQLPKEISKFIVNDNYIFSYEKNILTIFSFIGNKVVFNSAISKNEIKDIKFVNNLLFVLTTSEILVLDLIQKKVKLKVLFESVLFDTDGKYIITIKDNILHKINFDKYITKYPLDLDPTSKIVDIKIRENYFFIQQEKNLYLFDKKLYLVTQNCNSFEVKDGIVYVYESIMQKYSINKILKKDIIKVLTVDDSTTMRLIIKSAILNNFKDVVVYEAKNGQIALDMLEKNPDINLMFLDWNMPVLNGKDTVIKIRENPKFDKLKIIMATTENDKDKIREMITYGVKGYIIKPLKPTSIVPVTKKMIELIKQERENV